MLTNTNPSDARVKALLLRLTKYQHLRSLVSDEGELNSERFLEEVASIDSMRLWGNSTWRTQARWHAALYDHNLSEKELAALVVLRLGHPDLDLSHMAIFYADRQEPTLRTIALVGYLLRRGVRHTDVVAQTKAGSAFVTAVDTFFGFRQAYEDFLIDEADRHLDEGAYTKRQFSSDYGITEDRAWKVLRRVKQMREEY